jgi:hypothetical protein
MQPPKAKNPVVGPVHSERGFPFTARPLGRAQLLDPTLLRHRGDGAALAPDAPIRVANMILEGRESMPNVFGRADVFGRTRQPALRLFSLAECKATRLFCCVVA